MNKGIPSFAFLACALIPAALVISCATAKSVSSVDYSSERSVRYEIDNARRILDENPVEALARAWALRENAGDFAEVDDLYAAAEKKTLEDFRVAVDSSRWADAIALYRSLEALSMAPEGWNETSLGAKRADAWKLEGNKTLSELDTVVRSTPEDEAPSSLTVSRMIKGTVTVWVDRGLRIERGVGYADRVIGSAFFIDSRGYLITNYHVIDSEVNPKYEGYSRLYIKVGSDQDSRIPAKVVGWDPVLDLALIKTEIEPPAVFQLGSSEDLKVGNRIYAIGSPAGLEQTLTSGIVSAQKRRLLSLGDVLQIDAPINHGNSGGPIVDEAGRVQAVVFAGIEPYEGLNFAIPVEFLRIILPDLYAGGKVSHPWLGAWGKTAPTGANIGAAAVSATAGGTTGGIAGGGVTLVYSLPGSPCEIAGIPEGTVITAINGKAVSTLEELQSFVIRERPRTIVRLTGIAPSVAKSAAPIASGGQAGQADQAAAPRDWFVMLSERPAVPGERIFDSDIESKALLPVFGLDLEQIGNSKKYNVVSVVRGSVADESGFSAMDVVEIKSVEVNRADSYVSVQLFTKKRKAGYLESYIGLTASLDSPSYF